ncbi:LytTR family transcriptional regulator [Chitinophaga horti]|uniref:LytTR family transcriptional regulator n=1 Tax=Chitinophaga horti TaxID=2920382 RepID=A0ABY6JC94_9BACT|nr:LytTR family DNA-binding domain-containing protein [Chitinophaga horti]UYQ95924.1 LytTR family transcriptional regulator [Chitinophaga horti]
MIEDLLVLEVDDNYVRFITMQDDYSSRISLEAALALMPEGSFIRVNRGCAVALRHVERIEKTQVTIAGRQLALAKGGYEQLKKKVVVIGGAG